MKNLLELENESISIFLLPLLFYAFFLTFFNYSNVWHIMVVQIYNNYVRNTKNISLFNI